MGKLLRERDRHNALLLSVELAQNLTLFSEFETDEILTGN